MSRFNETGPSGEHGGKHRIVRITGKSRSENLPVKFIPEIVVGPTDIKSEAGLSLAIREKAVSKLIKGVRYFDSPRFGPPPLLREAVSEISQSLVTSKALTPDKFLTPKSWPGYHPPEKFYTIPSGKEGGLIHIAVKETSQQRGTKEREIDRIIFHRFKKNDAGVLQETLVSFLGLGADKEGLQSFYLADQVKNYPLGVHVDFSWRDPSDEIRAQFSGYLNSPQDRSTWRLDGYGDKEILPWMNDRLIGNSFSLIVDNALLGSIERTLQPEFYSHDLPACMSRVASERA